MTITALFRGEEAERAARRVAEHVAHNRAIEAARIKAERALDRHEAERRESAQRDLAERQVELPFDEAAPEVHTCDEDRRLNEGGRRR